MSRYIRTKDGEIFEYAGRERTPYGDLISTNGKRYRFDCVLKEADTIGELCDEFVCENSLIDSSPRKENGQIIGRYQKIDNAIMLAKKGLIVYGAIWVDGNLIKVAQINNNGELELL